MHAPIKAQNILFATILLTSATHAAVTIGVTTNSDGAASVDNGATISAPSLTGVSGTDSTIITTFTVSDLDLSSIEAGANNVSFTFDVTYSAVDAAGLDAAIALFNSATVGVAGGGNTTQIGNNDVLTYSISAPTSVTGFTGTIDLNGFTQVTLSNFQNAADTATIVFNDMANTSIDVISNLVFNENVIDPSITTPIDATSFTDTGTGSNHRLGPVSFEFEASSTAIPEPSSTILISLGGLAFILRRRR